MRESVESGILFLVGAPLVALGCADLAVKHSRVLASRGVAWAYNSIIGRGDKEYIPAHFERHEGHYLSDDDPDFYLVPGEIKKRDIKSS